MPLTEMVVMVAITSALILGFIAVLRLVGTLVTHRTIRKAINKDPAIAQEIIDRVTGRPEQGTGDDRIAVILVALGIAMIGAPLIAVDDPGIVRFAVGAALFPLIVGAALWLRVRALKRAAARDSAE